MAVSHLFFCFRSLFAFVACFSHLIFLLSLSHPISSFTAFLTQVTTVIRARFKIVYQFVATKLTALREFIVLHFNAYYDKIRTWIATQWKRLTDLVVKIKDALYARVQHLIQTYILAPFNSIRNFVASQWAKLTEVFQALKQALYARLDACYQFVVSRVQAIRDRVIAFCESIRLRLVAFWQTVRTRLVRFVEALHLRLVAIWQAVSLRLVAIYQSVSDFVTSVYTTVSMRLNQFYQTYLASYYARLVAFFVLLHTKAAAFVQFVSSWLNYLHTTFAAFCHSVVDFYSQLRSKCLEVLDHLTSTIGSFLSRQYQAIGTFFLSIRTALTAVLQSTINNLVSFAVQQWNFFKPLVMSLFTQMKSTFQHGMALLSSGWTWLKAKVTSTFKSLIASLHEFVQPGYLWCLAVAHHCYLVLQSIYISVATRVGPILATIRENAARRRALIAAFVAGVVTQIKATYSSLSASLTLCLVIVRKQREVIVTELSQRRQQISAYCTTKAAEFRKLAQVCVSSLVHSPSPCLTCCPFRFDCSGWLLLHSNAVQFVLQTKGSITLIENLSFISLVKFLRH
jgi:phage-related protein